MMYVLSDDDGSVSSKQSGTEGLCFTALNIKTQPNTNVLFNS